MKWDAPSERCFYRNVLTTSTPGSDIQATKDHVFPISLGGGGSSRRHPNIVIACSRCNRRKANMHPRDWYWQIEKTELRRKFLERLFVLFPKDVPKIKSELKVDEIFPEDGTQQ